MIKVLAVRISIPTIIFLFCLFLLAAYPAFALEATSGASTKREAAQQLQTLLLQLVKQHIRI